MEYQRIAAAGFFFLPSTDALFPCGGAGVLERCGVGAGGLVFGTLLGPEATGPGLSPVFVCFWFPGCTDHARLVPFFLGAGVWGVWYGVVV